MLNLKELLFDLILPPLGLILLSFYGLWLASRHPRTGRGIATFSLLALVAFSLPSVTDALMRSLESYPPISAQNLARAQAIVVLGGNDNVAAPEFGGATAGPFTLEQLRYGVYLQKRSGLPILVKGGGTVGGTTIAETMKEVIERDFHGQVKWVQAVSRDGTESAAHSATILKASGISRIALVGLAWQLPRVVKLFEGQGFEVLPAPTGFATHGSSLFEEFVPSTKSLERSSMALHEWFSIFIQRVAMKIVTFNQTNALA